MFRVSRALREDGWLEVMYDKDTVAYNEYVFSYLLNQMANYLP